MQLAQSDQVIRSTVASLRTASFKADPLFSMSQSFEMSLRTSAIKRHGAVIEAAILDALQTSSRAKCSKISVGTFSREVDVFCVDEANKKILAIDVKRGNSHHDSGKRREMKVAAKEMTDEICQMFTGYQVKFGFLHYYSDTESHVEAVSIAELKAFTGVDVRPFVERATLFFSRSVDRVIMERASHG